MNPYPNTDEVVTEEDRKRWKKMQKPAYPRSDKVSFTRQTTAGIKESDRAKSDARTHLDEDVSRNEARGKLTASSYRHIVSSSHHNASRDEASSDSEDERRKPRDYTDRHHDDAKGKGAITSEGTATMQYN